ncbi:succinyl-CoA ligase alpha-chain [Hypomontagnella submonticulosa]|nr:succinyl-CoA ligase alpha-chain [Hypomontagnella submonticulosa]
MIRSVPKARHLTIVPSWGFGSARALFQNRYYSSYDSTLKNLKIGSHTRVIFQGFTGKQATVNARESLEWGTNIVGGVTPGREGEHLGLPVLPTVRKAMEVLKPDATGIYVAAEHAAAAIEEAIEAEVPLIVAVAEHIPLHSFQPLPCFEPGRIGIVARSGTLSYEAAASTLRSGLGQSMCIGVGGDILPGTSLKEGLQILTEDNDTEAIALIGEVGGYAELEAADWIREYRLRTENPKPIAALVAGRCAIREVTMGHAGAVKLLGEPSVLTKIAALEVAGVTVVNHPSRFGSALKSMLTGSTPTEAVDLTSKPVSQWAGMDMSDKPYMPTDTTDYSARSLVRQIHDAIFLYLLKSHHVATTRTSRARYQNRIVITINRATGNPCVVIFYHAGTTLITKKFDFTYGPSGAQDMRTSDIARHLNLNFRYVNSLDKMLRQLTEIFAKEQGVVYDLWIVANYTAGTIEVKSANFDSGGPGRPPRRTSDIQGGLPGESKIGLPFEDVLPDGIVYIPLGDERANIGTLVNGAGLAMNTVDALADAGGRAANFLDTGGKATSQTVKTSFERILLDSRVECIFVNIFGGLTRGDMIAEGIVMAFRDLKMTVPVVVRIRGTNEKEGQKIIADSGLPLFAFDDFDEAAAKAIELANKS